MSLRPIAASAAAALLVLSFPSAARAQFGGDAPMERPVQIGFGGGVILPRGGRRSAS
jgi:hypothetical protein